MQLSDKAQRVFTNASPIKPTQSDLWLEWGLWSARWIWHSAAIETPAVCAFRLVFSLEQSRTFCVHVSADERYELFLDGQLIGRGPERGDPQNWFYETYELSLVTGDHTLVARVWTMGEKAPTAQMSLRPGFLLGSNEKSLHQVLDTGIAPWETKILGGYSWQSPLSAWGTGWNEIIRGEEFDWGYERGEGQGWVEPQVGIHGADSSAQHEVEAFHRLRPATLPPMMDQPRRAGRALYVADWQARPVAEIPLIPGDSLLDEFPGWQQWLDVNEPITIPPYTRRRVVIDTLDYVCARPHLVTGGGRGARIDIDWTEGFFPDIYTWSKGHRAEWEGKVFAAIGQQIDDKEVTERAPVCAPGNTFWPDGGENRTFSTLWWHAGRFIQVVIETADEPLLLREFSLRETRYPLEVESSFASSEPRLETLAPMMVRAVQMCAHETYMDCPFFEQIMYLGDTRLEILVTYVLTGDDRLPKKALQLFDWSRLQSGLTQSRYPSRVRQTIPPFSLWWVAMVHDFALWRDDAAFVRSLLPGVHGVCDYFASLIGEDGLMQVPAGWNFTDWVRTTTGDQIFYGDDPNWRYGVPPRAKTEISGVLNWHAALIFRLAGELEGWHGESQLADLQAHRAQKLAAAIDTTFWNEERGLYADDLNHEHWSEHAQCLALLSGLVPEHKRERVGKALIELPDLARTTIYFTHYLFETYRLLGRVDTFFDRLNAWNELIENGLKTTVEMPEPTRSDCHGWGAHPLFHYFVTLAGIRPAGPGFRAVTIDPQLGPLQWLDARIPHPKGAIRVQVSANDVVVELPDGVRQT